MHWTQTRNTKMHTLQWTHTRKGTPMTVKFSTRGSALLRVMMVRTVRPGWKFLLNGEPV